DMEPRQDLLDLHRCAYRRFVRDVNGGRPMAITLTTAVDALPGSGLGSSSTLVVAMVTAMAAWCGIALGEYDIARLAFLIERRDLGLAGGRQDQYAAAFGGVNFMEFHEHDRVLVHPLEIEPWLIAGRMAAGGLAGKVSGAGGGGFLMLFVDPTRGMDVVRALEGGPGQLSTCHFPSQGARAWKVY